MAALVESAGLRRKGRLRGASAVERLALGEGQDVASAAALLRASPLVEFAEPNFVIAADQLTPNDPRFGEQWALRNTGQRGGPAGADVGASAAWSRTTGSHATVVAVVDSGIDFTHPDLRNNRWANPSESRNRRDDDADGYADDLHGWDWVAGSPSPGDANGHGTAVAGVIAAEGNNAVGVAGVMWRASLMSLRVLDASGRGTVADAVEAIDYASAHGAQVINCSWGLDEPSRALREALARAGARGALVVAAAGNGARNSDFAPRYPASYGLPSVLAVASTSAADELSTWSNWGAAAVGVAAPGENVITTRAGGGYQYVSGSSVSAAHASGVAGLVKTLNPQLGSRQVRAMILRGARRVAGLHGRVAAGGVLDAGRSLGSDNASGTDEENGGENGDGESEGDKETRGKTLSAQSAGAGLNAPAATPEASPLIAAPAANLPDLNMVRQHVAPAPRAILPVPSTKRRCWTGNPRCNEADGLPAPTPAPPPLPTPSPSPLPSPLPLPSPAPSPSPIISPSPTPFALVASSGGAWAEIALGPPRSVFASVSDGAPAPRAVPSSEFYSAGGGYAVTDAPSGAFPALARAAGFSALVFLPDAPTNLSVTATSAAQVSLSWTPATGASSYRIERSTSLTDAYTVVGNTGSTTFNDATVTGGNSYLYRVRSVDAAGGESVASNRALATAISFTDPQLTAGVTQAKKEHVYELRTAVNAARRAAGLADATWLHPDLTVSGVRISADHVRQLRDRLNEALSALGIPLSAYDDTPLLTGTQTGAPPIRKIHVEQLRQRATRGVLSGPGEAGVGTGLTARYFNNSDFTDYRLARTDATVNFDWGTGSPAPVVSADTFSARWTGQVVAPATGTYTFYTQSDDGVRLFVDRQTLVDNWGPHPLAENSGQITLQGGQAYDIRMDYWEQAGGAVSKLLWQGPGITKQVVPQSRLYGCWKSFDALVRDFHQGALARQPNSTELQTWADRLAQAQGGALLLGEARALGRSLFHSQEYANRNRTNQQYVEDLYAGYLQRAPDAAGLTYWVGQVNADPANGRENARRAFEQSTEFAEKTAKLCGTDPAASEYNFAAARIDPSNRTGGSGVDPYSRNFNWSLPLVHLPGRSGLDLGLSLTYNSLVWTRDGGGLAVSYDADGGFPSPGFRLGFPVIQDRFRNPQANRDAYLLVTPSGARVELRETATPGTFESVDSSYMQLTEGGGSLLLRTADGTRMTFLQLAGDYHCVEVKDRNGNYLSISYDAHGQISSVSDTLGRTLVFNYDAFQNLLSITQAWKRETETGAVDETHVWASFGYSDKTFDTNFPSAMTVIGPRDGEAVPLLTQVGLADGSYYKFDYTTWGQVRKVTHYAADSAVGGVPQDTHRLSYMLYNLPTDASQQQTDCPRFTEQRVWVENGVMNQSAEVVTAYGPWTPDMASCDVTAADGTVFRRLYATSADRWMKGLTTRSEVRIGGQVKKSTDFTWTQDDTAPSVNYRLNPRIERTEISDEAGNSRQTRVTYAPPAEFSLPKKVEEFAADGLTVLRTTVTDYDIPNAGEYTSRRIIGLPRLTRLYEGPTTGGTLVSKVEYVYDVTTAPPANEPEFLQPLPAPAAQHDAANYGASFVRRGNLNLVRRYDVTGGASAYVESQARYNVTGSPVFAKDAEGHKTQISYADDFYQGVNRSSPLLQTYAYPTSVSDADGYSSTAKYNYDTGWAVSERTPKPNETQNVPGPEVYTLYDAAGRVARVTNSVNAARTRFVYPAGMTTVETHSYVVEGQPDEAYSARVLDGAGRVRAVSSAHPGSAGGYAGQYFDYDVLGRLVRQSRPTEHTGAAGWPAAGDDAQTGWVYSRQTYDWQGRPLVTTNADGTTVENKYGGCGCAGGAVVTSRDEMGRRHKVTYDALGRVWKSQVLSVQPKAQELSHGSDADVDSTTTNTYNARDQLTEVRTQVGVAGAAQVTTNTYDGYGRLLTRHTPERDAGRSTVYAYNADDTLQSVTDARGARADFAYNGRRQTTSITYNLSGVIAGQNVAATPNVTFSYDAAGNRLSMVETALGRVDYVYDMLSRLQTETRRFEGLSGSYPLTYGYNLGGGLKSVTDPAGKQVSYGFDYAGRVTAVTGTPFTGGSTYASGLLYRAWGALKALTYGNTVTLAITHDSLMRGQRFKIDGNPWQSGPPSGAQTDYQYYADGQLRFADDGKDNRFDRAYAYDHAGRLTEAYTGTEARNFVNNVAGGLADGPYRQSYQYDAWGAVTRRDARYWTQPGTTTFATYVDGRRQDESWQYDAAGNVTADPDLSYTFDAAGRNRQVTSADAQRTVSQWYAGDGQVVKREERTAGGALADAAYYVRSSVLGGRVLTQLTPTGQKQKTYVYLGGEAVAQQLGADGMVVSWRHADPLTGARSYSITDGIVWPDIEQDPAGVNVGRENPANSPPTGGEGQDAYASLLVGPAVGDDKCEVDGFAFDCELARRLVGLGAAAPCPDNNCGSRVMSNGALGVLDWNKDTGQLGYYYSEFTQAWEIDDTTGDQTNPSAGRWERVFRPAAPDPRFNSLSFANFPEPSRTTQGPGEIPIGQCDVTPLVRFNLRDESRDGAVTKFPFIGGVVTDDFEAAIQEINRQVPGGIGFNEAFRTTEHQAALYENYLEQQKKWDALPLYKRIGRTPPLPAAEPGTSAHEAGLAVDIPRKYLSVKVLVILEKHGFRQDVPGDPIHVQWNKWKTLTEEEQRARISMAQSFYHRCLR